MDHIPTNKIKLAVLPGDGIGPEVIEQAVKVLDAVAERYGHFFSYCYGDIGAIAIDHTGSPLPEETLEACRTASAILMGAIGHPRYDQDPNAKVRPEQGLLQLRKSLGLFANIRPVTAYDGLLDLSPLRREILAGTDLIIYRELTGGLYFGEKEEGDRQASDLCRYTVEEVDRVARLAFEKAGQRRKRLTLVDKANVLATSRLWRRRIMELAGDYPDVEVEYLYVDNAAMQLVLNPSYFDVILTENLFGDILSDEASVLAGSLGMLPSASIGLQTSLFEPVHGSYPQAAGQDIANPIAAVLSAGMMLDQLGLQPEAEAVRLAVTRVLRLGVGTPDLKPNIGWSCSQFGDLLASAIIEGEEFSPRREKMEAGASTII